MMLGSKVFSEVIADHIAEKRAIGYKYDKNERQLKRVLQLYHENGRSDLALDKLLVLLWTTKTPYETETNRLHRVGTIRELAKYMVRMGYDAYIIPPRSFPYPEMTYSPYIFSNEELSAFFNQADRSKITIATPFQNIQLPLLFRMLYGCGLRISEALSLKQEDVNLNKGTIYIRNTKFDKERVLPIANSLVQRCHEYLSQMQKYSVWHSSEYFFSKGSGDKYTERSAYGYFRDILWKAGISHGGRGKGPRLHDFRHTYAVHCLRNWVREGKDLTTSLPYLSVYMGHVGVRSTQYYLKLTGELYPEIIFHLDNTYQWIIPEVDN